MNGQVNAFRGVNYTIHLNRILMLKPRSDNLFNFVTGDQSMQEKREVLLGFGFGWKSFWLVLWWFCVCFGFF